MLVTDEVTKVISEYLLLPLLITKIFCRQKYLKADSTMILTILSPLLLYKMINAFLDLLAFFNTTIYNSISTIDFSKTSVFKITFAFANLQTGSSQSSVLSFLYT